MGHFHLVLTDAGISYFRRKTLFRVMLRMGRTKNTNNFRVFVALTPGFGKISEHEVNGRLADSYSENLENRKTMIHTTEIKTCCNTIAA